MLTVHANSHRLLICYALNQLLVLSGDKTQLQANGLLCYRKYLRKRWEIKIAAHEAVILSLYDIIVQGRPVVM